MTRFLFGSFCGSIANLKKRTKKFTKSILMNVWWDYRRANSYIYKMWLIRTVRDVHFYDMTVFHINFFNNMTTRGFFQTKNNGNESPTFSRMAHLFTKYVLKSLWRMSSSYTSKPSSTIFQNKKFMLATAFNCFPNSDWNGTGSYWPYMHMRPIKKENNVSLIFHPILSCLTRINID